MKKTLVLAVSALAFASSAAFAQSNTTDGSAAPAAAKTGTHAKKHTGTKKVHKAHVAKKGDASPEESSTK